MTRGVKRFTDLRAWQACDVFKKAVYRPCEIRPIAEDLGRRKQIEESSSRTTAHIAEGFGRFNPADFPRFCVIARSSLMESQNHLLDFADKRYISEDVKRYAMRAGLANVESPRGRNADARTRNVEEERGHEKEPRRAIAEPNRETEHEQRTEKAEQ